MLSNEKDYLSKTQRTTERVGRKTFIDRVTDELKDYMMEQRARSSERECKIKGLGSYGTYGCASSYPGQWNER